ncbi:hypothetical protein B0I73DRAFT_16791 [Yarrowia lipolytica]|jgi:energy-coupling factor transporter ATP-binding protein EcfA2|uniref:Increased recombination centers protein 6 n=1 Tax=Yarrowia lipolytica TaxID=4952 RepID=A0A371C8E8_YARLL|nr:hypothetical protein B0I71DRAFT_31783 [Yarrowia lipolytica]RDW36606.1 hypothetical protein B0I73DRAFT_16791 [Yarrowia lipolytica]
MRNKILVVGPPGSGKLTMLKELMGTVSPVTGSHAGIIEEYHIKNKYYEARVGVWVDEFLLEGDSTQLSADRIEGLVSLPEWTESFCSNEAKEVRDSIKAVVFTLRHGSDAAHLEPQLKVLEQLVGMLDNDNWDGSLICLQKGHVSPELAAQLDTVCFDYGFEYISHLVSEQGETTGYDRLQEAIEVLGWETQDEAKETPVPDPILTSPTLMARSSPSLHASSFDARSLSLSPADSDMLKGLLNDDLDNFQNIFDKLKIARNSNLSDEQRTRLANDLAEQLIGGEVPGH